MMIWRDEEAVLTEVMANYQSKPFYLLPLEEPLETLFGILEGKKRAYLSYPITHMEPSLEAWFAEKNKQRDKLRRKLVVFDPRDIKDVEFISQAAEARREGKKRIEYRLRNGSISVDCDEVLQIEDDVKFQTVHRDFKIIDQCNMVVALYPQSVKSQGVADELKYGSTNKDVFLITPLKGIDPFTDFNITARYETVEDFLASLE
jgi:adenylate kinase